MQPLEFDGELMGSRTDWEVGIQFRSRRVGIISQTDNRRGSSARGNFQPYEFASLSSGTSFECHENTNQNHHSD
jgi:hypothetical protein